MTRIRYVVSMFLVALFTAGVMTIGQVTADDETKPSEVAKSGCVGTIDFNTISQEEYEELYGRSQ